MDGATGFIRHWLQLGVRLFLSVCRFALVSGAGLTLDLAIYHALVYLAGVPPGISNFLSALCGITFVYVVSGRFVFIQNKFSWIKYLAWILYQLLSITAFSLMVYALTSKLGLSASLSKILTLPFSFSTNYVFMALLVRGPVIFQTVGDVFFKTRTGGKG